MNTKSRVLTGKGKMIQVIKYFELILNKSGRYALVNGDTNAGLSHTFIRF